MKIFQNQNKCNKTIACSRTTNRLWTNRFLRFTIPFFFHPLISLLILHPYLLTLFHLISYSVSFSLSPLNLKNIKMYNLIKSGLINPQSTCFHLRSAFFHSTPVLERGRRNYWNSRYNNNNNNRRSRRNPFRQNILRNINAYAEYLIHNWHSEFDDDEQPSDKGPSSFRRDNNGSRRNWTRGQGRQSRRRRGYNFCEDEEDDDDVEHVFRSAFGDRFFFWSFVHEDYPNWRNSSRHSNGYRTSWKQRQRIEDEYDYESEDDSPKSNLASERIALGLSVSGPLKLEDVKNAYRTCALKWHPDRHQGSSKAAAEEKFKLCTAAYQSLCDRLAVN